MSARLFSTSAYYAAKVTATLPFQLVSSFCLTLIIYGMAGLRRDPVAIVQSCGISILMSLIAVQVMHACAVLAPTQDMAFMYSIAWTAVQLLFNNFAITFKEIYLPWLEALKWLSAAYYAFEALSVVEFEGLRVSCAGGMDIGNLGFLKELLPNMKLLRSRAAAAALERPSADCVLDAGPVLAYFDFGRGFAASAAILVCYWLLAHAATFAALKVVARKEKR